MPYFSHDILVPEKTIQLNPLAVFRDPGHLYDSPRSAIRALQILELLGSSGRPMRAVEIGNALDLSPSSTIQLLKIMMDWAYLIFDPSSKRYYPSPRVAKLGVVPARDYLGFEVLQRTMRSLQRHFDAVSLCVSQGAFMQVVDSVLETPLMGLHVPLFGSSSGAAWLSSQSDARVRAAIRLCRRDLGRQVDEPAILEQIARIRAQGYAFGGMSHEDEIRAISIPLPANRHGAVMVLSMTGKRQGMEERRAELAALSKDIIGQHFSAAAEA